MSMSESLPMLCGTGQDFEEAQVRYHEADARLPSLLSKRFFFGLIVDETGISGWSCMAMAAPRLGKKVVGLATAAASDMLVRR